MTQHTYGASGSNPSQLQLSRNALGGLARIAGGEDRAREALALAQELSPQPEPVDPYLAALKFFTEMGVQASQPGATVLGSAVSAGRAPLEYLEAKAREKDKAKQTMLSTATTLASSLRPPKTTGSTKAVKVVDDEGNVKFMSESEAIRTGATPYIADTTKATTFKERKFFKSGFDPVVVKNPDDAKLFETQGWNSVPPEGWTDSKGGTDEGTAEVQSSSILDSGVIIYAFKDGTRKVVNSLGEEVTGEDAQAAIKEAEERGVKLQQDRSGARRAGTVGVNTALNAFTEVGKIRKNIANLTEALNLVEVEGANTGKIESFIPNWRAATIELAQVRAELGLDVVGSVTFGALSEGELNIALATALPIELQEQDLIDWLNRKINAQKKLSSYLEEQAIFLSDGDKTVGDWLRHVKENQKELKRIEAERKQSGTDYNFSTMNEQELENIDLDTLDNDQIDAYLKRMEELGL